MSTLSVGGCAEGGRRMNHSEASIIRLLSTWRQNRICIDHCMVAGMGSRIFDLWTMTKSYWPVYDGYEVKLTRADFRSDMRNPSKWKTYAWRCNRLWYAAPAGVLQKCDMPDECGLLAIEGDSIKVLKRAPNREIKPPVMTMLYVLFNRCRIMSVAPTCDHCRGMGTRTSCELCGGTGEASVDVKLTRLERVQAALDSMNIGIRQADERIREIVRRGCLIEWRVDSTTRRGHVTSYTERAGRGRLRVKFCEDTGDLFENHSRATEVLPEHITAIWRPGATAEETGAGG